MKFDRTFIAIRRRNMLEILDLALHVTRDHFRPLLLLLLVGAIPFQALNWWMTGWMVTEKYVEEHSSLYVWMMTLLVTSQAQLGTTFVTHYLGQAMFVDRPQARQSIKNVMRGNGYLLWVHGVVRMVIPIAAVAYFACSKNEDSRIAASLFLLMLGGIALMVRAFRPFASEILLLEQTPIRQTALDQIDFSRRSHSLHTATSGDLFGRFLLIALIALAMGFSFFAGFLLIDSTLSLGGDSTTSTLVTFYWPMALWLVAGFVSVVHFLSYIDIRIRQEGWSVELRMRAEALRLAASIES
jgi:hypothetical protein